MPYIVIMFITTVPNRNSNPTILLRESYREGGKVHVRTLANLTHWDKEKVATLDAVLRGGKISMDGEFDILPGRAHGNIHAVLGTMRRLEIETSSAAAPARSATSPWPWSPVESSNLVPGFSWRGLWPK